VGKKDPRVDAYIAKSADYAKPILKRLRKLIHAGCPKVEETIKWSSPFFMHAGSILCCMPAFKQHIALIFWHRALPKSLAEVGLDKQALARFRRLTDVSDLPKDVVVKRLVQIAAAMNEEGPQSRMARSGAKRKKKPAPKVPANLQAALNKNRKARATFDRLSASRQREYVEWITEAKREETCKKRLATAIEWLADGRSRNWKYGR
jgi:uncharacterized protein YdeI (YjbR/CyaY-like superfamily)